MKHKATLWLSTWFSLLVFFLAACSSTPAPQETLESEVVTTSYALFYRSSNGAAAFGTFDTLGNYTNLATYTLSTNWSQIVKVNGGVFFYRASDGVAAFVRYSATGAPNQLQSWSSASGTFSPGWTHIVYYPPTQKVFFYRSSNGLGATGSFNTTTGAFTQLKSYPAGNFITNITQYIYSSKGGNLVSYKASNGDTRTASIDSLGNYTTRKVIPLSATWTHLVNTPNGVFFYRTTDGLGAFGTFDTLGNFTQLNSFPAGSFTTGWTRIEQLPTGILFYRASDGLMVFARFSSTGAYIHKKTSTLSANWSLVSRAR